MAHLVVSVEAFVVRREAACGPFRKPVPSRWDVGGMGVADCVCVVGSQIESQVGPVDDLYMILFMCLFTTYTEYIYIYMMNPEYVPM